MSLIRVTNIQHGCVNDGPGVRTTVFLKGCTLTCPWCCNPETQSYKEQYYIDEDKCLHSKGISSKLCNHCMRKGGPDPIKCCPFGIVEPVQKDYSVESLFNEITRDKLLYKESGGGVTFSGGEPLLQAQELKPLLESLSAESIHIVFESTLIAPKETIVMIRDYVDLLLLDIKLQPEMMLNNSEYLKKIRIGLEILNDLPVVYRLVYVDSLYEKQSVLIRCLHLLGIGEIELLQAHNLGQKKYEKLHRECKDYTANLDKMKLFAGILNENGIQTKKLTL